MSVTYKSYRATWVIKHVNIVNSCGEFDHLYTEFYEKSRFWRFIWHSLNKCDYLLIEFHYIRVQFYRNNKCNVKFSFFAYRNFYLLYCILIYDKKLSTCTLLFLILSSNLIVENKFCSNFCHSKYQKQ
jgi:hypothetical protein